MQNLFTFFKLLNYSSVSNFLRQEFMKNKRSILQIFNICMTMLHSSDRVFLWIFSMKSNLRHFLWIKVKLLFCQPPPYKIWRCEGVLRVDFKEVNNTFVAKNFSKKNKTIFRVHITNFLGRTLYVGVHARLQAHAKVTMVCAPKS